jgi:hypothetical protein
MKRKRAAERSRLASLAEARSMLWALQQLTAKNATRDRPGRSYLFELHQIATRGVNLVGRLVDEMEVRTEKSF